jgi:molybdate transport system ATP-binding protein
VSAQGWIVSDMASSGRDPKPFISVEDVSLRLGDGKTFERIHWEILTNQQWAVIGPNGSGKSSLMKAICGQVPVSTGNITYHFVQNGASRECRNRRVSPHDQIAYVAFDSQRMVAEHDSPYHQARWNRGVSNFTWSVSEYLSERHVKKINPYVIVEEQPDPSEFMAITDKVVELLGIEELLTKDIQQISNGERRKVLLARALLRSPQLLVLDNPFTGLDAGFRVRLERIISCLMRDDMRIILVTNGRDEIPPGITHILLMEHNGIVAQGPRETIVRDLHARQKVGLAHSETFAQLVDREQQPVGMAEEDQILVHMDNVSVSYDGVQILKQISWSVRKGENWALLGPNGAGKTTLLSLILGDNPHAYANDITLFGKRRGSGESIWDIKKRIGWVAPELHLYYPKHVSCFDVVCSGFFDSMGRYHRCSAKHREAAMSWLQLFGMLQYADMAFGLLSEGEQRMILMARALVKEPGLLVMDEPCQGLDAGNRDRVLRMIEVMGDHTNASILYVTHHGDALPRSITHVLRLEKGRIVSVEKVAKSEMRRVSRD